VIRWLRSLDPQLPRSVYTLQTGGLLNAFGNGIVLPFTFIYLHNVRDISLGIAGLALGTNAAVSLVAGPAAGAFVDRVGGRRTLAVALVFLAAGYAGFALVHEPWQAFAVAAVTGIGNGAFWPAQSTLIAGLTPLERRTSAFAMQRIVMNLGIGLGALAGGLIASAERPGSFELLFVLDGLTFVAYLAVLLLFVNEPAERRAARAHGGPGYAVVLRDRAFLGVIALNSVFIFAGFAGFDVLPVYAKNEAGIDEQAIGLIFFLNTVVIVLAQLPVAKLSEGHRRMRVLALLGVVWAAAWLLVPLAGLKLEGGSAVLLLAVAMSIFALGECLHGAVQAPLVADLAEPSLLGRYMALSALSWQVGFMLGPAIGGFALAVAPHGVWVAAAAICLANGAVALALEPRLPLRARRTPVAAAA
jgi:MFS family permease